MRDIYAPPSSTRRFALAELELLDQARIKEPSEIIWLIAAALAKAGVMAPLTMRLYAFYWEKQGGGRQVRLNQSSLQDYIDACRDGCEAASKFGDLIGVLLDAAVTPFKA